MAKVSFARTAIPTISAGDMGLTGYVIPWFVMGYAWTNFFYYSAKFMSCDQR
jgi:hypothetical protein